MNLIFFQIDHPSEEGNIYEKYRMTKRLANMRREEILKLRKKLGLPPDGPID